MTSVDTSSVSSRARGCGLTRPSGDGLKAKFGDRFNWVSHFSVVIGPVTPRTTQLSPTTLRQVCPTPQRSLIVSKMTTLLNDAVNVPRVKAPGLDLALTANVQGICNFVSNVVAVVTTHVRVL